MDNLALKRVLEVEQKPFSFGEYQNTYDIFVHSAKHYPEQPALSFFADAANYRTPHTWTYNQLLNDITQIANNLRSAGLQRGEVIAYILPNLPETHLIHWAGETAGIVLALNPLLEASQLIQLLNTANAKLLVCPALYVNQDIATKIENIANNVPGLCRIYCVDQARYLGIPTPHSLPENIAGIPCLDFHANLLPNKNNTAELNFPAPTRDDVCAMLCTGGTTGLPKIATHLHSNEIANTLQISAIAEFFSHGNTILTALPLFHVNALIGTGLTVFLTGGHVLLATINGYRSPGLIENMWAILDHFEVTAFSGVPTIYGALLAVPRTDYALRKLKYAICGASPMPVGLFNKFQQETGVTMMEGYGLTESCCVASIYPAVGEPRIGSIGVRLPWQKAAILREGTEKPAFAPSNEMGELILKGPNIFPGYLDADQTASTFTSLINEQGHAEQWLRTGDMARIDEQGFIWLTGRKKELIIRGGHNIDPKMIEEAFVAHPQVAIAAAVGRPDAYAGEVPVVYVQPREHEKIDIEEILHFACKNIPERAAHPKAVILIENMPQTAVGKIFKPDLQSREIAYVISEVLTAEGIRPQQMDVLQHKTKGLIATLTVSKSDAEKTRQALEKFAFKCDVVAAPGEI